MGAQAILAQVLFQWSGRGLFVCLFTRCLHTACIICDSMVMLSQQAAGARNRTAGVQKQWTKNGAPPKKGDGSFDIKNPDNVVWLGNLPPGADFEEVKMHMAHAGKVKHVKISNNRTGFACFSNPGEAQIAIATLNGTVFNGKVIKVDSYTGGTDLPPRSGGGKSYARPQPNQSGKGQRRVGNSSGEFGIWGKSKPAGARYTVRHPTGTVWLGNLPEDLGFEEVRQHMMASGGECLHVQVMKKTRTGFAVFATPQQAQDAKEGLNGSTLGGSEIIVDTYNKNPKAPRTGFGSNQRWTKGKGGKGGGKGGRGRTPSGGTSIRKPENTVWVGNLAPGTTYDEVAALLNTAGSCKHVEIKNKGTAFAFMSNPEEVAIAISTVSGSLLRGQEIQLDGWERKPKMPMVKQEFS